jgi:hypothetical protein
MYWFGACSPRIASVNTNTDVASKQLWNADSSLVLRYYKQKNAAAGVVQIYWQVCTVAGDSLVCEQTTAGWRADWASLKVVRIYDTPGMVQVGQDRRKAVYYDVSAGCACVEKIRFIH